MEWPARLPPVGGGGVSLNLIFYTHLEIPVMRCFKFVKFTFFDKGDQMLTMGTGLPIRLMHYLKCCNGFR